MENGKSLLLVIPNSSVLYLCRGKDMEDEFTLTVRDLMLKEGLTMEECSARVNWLKSQITLFGFS